MTTPLHVGQRTWLPPWLESTWKMPVQCGQWNWTSTIGGACPTSNESKHQVPAHTVAGTRRTSRSTPRSLFARISLVDCCACFDRLADRSRGQLCTRCPGPDPLPRRPISACVSAGILWQKLLALASRRAQNKDLRLERLLCIYGQAAQSLRPPAEPARAADERWRVFTKSPVRSPVSVHPCGF